VNHKTVYRLYREAGLAVRKHRLRKGVMGERQPLALPGNSINGLTAMALN